MGFVFVVQLLLLETAERETEVTTVVVRRADVRRTEPEEVGAASARLSRTRPIVAERTRAPQVTVVQVDVAAAHVPPKITLDKTLMFCYN